jgi:hypothetical protein
VWQHPPQDAALVKNRVRAFDASLARYNQCQAQAIGIGALQKLAQPVMRLRLAHPMQINPGLGIAAATRQFSQQAMLQRSQGLDLRALNPDGGRGNGVSHRFNGRSGLSLRNSRREVLARHRLDVSCHLPPEFDFVAG